MLKKFAKKPNKTASVTRQIRPPPNGLENSGHGALCKQLTSVTRNLMAEVVQRPTELSDGCRAPVALSSVQ